MKPFLPYGRHTIDEDDIDAVISVMRSDWLTTGPQVLALESHLQQVLEVPHVLSCSSATAGLHMAAQALELNSENAVIVPAISFLASASAPYFTGAEIVFADVNPISGLLTPEIFLHTIEHWNGKRIKAVIVVHLAGRVCDMRAIKAIADEHDIAIIEDACHALGASYTDNEGNHYPVGSSVHSDISVFSFHPVKTIAAGEGGAVTTRNPGLFKKLGLIRSHGVTRDPLSWTKKNIGFDEEGKANPWYYEMHAPALNYRMSDINSALANSQLKKLASFIERRAELASVYDRLLAPLAPKILPPTRQAGVNSGWHLYSVQVDFLALGMDRGTLMTSLQKQGIGSQVHYIPLPWQPFWQDNGWKPEYFSGATKYYESTLSLPMFPGMLHSDVSRVVQALLDC